MVNTKFAKLSYRFNGFFRVIASTKQGSISCYTGWDKLNTLAYSPLLTQGFSCTLYQCVCLLSATPSPFARLRRCYHNPSYVLTGWLYLSTYWPFIPPANFRLIMHCKMHASTTRSYASPNKSKAPSQDPGQIYSLQGNVVQLVWRNYCIAHREAETGT